jgi:alpha-tubulin suppressor-like RCC1 family protein
MADLSRRDVAFGVISSQVVQVSCGHAHTLFVLEPPPVEPSVGGDKGDEEGDDDGQADTGCSQPLLLACGTNVYSELGLGVCETGRCLPVPVVLPRTREAHIRIVSSGSHHSFCVLSDGVVLGWGRNNVGQLGKGDAEQVVCRHSLPTAP